MLFEFIGIFIGFPSWGGIHDDSPYGTKVTVLKMSNLDVGEAKGKPSGRFLQELRYTPQLSGGKDHGDFLWYLPYLPYLPSPQVVGTPRHRKKKIRC